MLFSPHGFLHLHHGNHQNQLLGSSWHHVPCFIKINSFARNFLFSYFYIQFKNKNNKTTKKSLQFSTFSKKITSLPKISPALISNTNIPSSHHPPTGTTGISSDSSGMKTLGPPRRARIKSGPSSQTFWLLRMDETQLKWMVFVAEKRGNVFQ